MMNKLKSDVVNYGDESIRVDYLKRVINSKTYVQIFLVGNLSRLLDKKTNYYLTDRYYANKKHAQEIVLPVIRSYLKNKLGGEEDKIDKLIKKINISSMVGNGIKDVSFAKHLMKERLTDKNLNHRVWDKMSSNKNSGILFDKQITDPTLCIVYVDTLFLVASRGNSLNSWGKSSEKIKELIRKGVKISSVPIYDLDSSLVEEGNHRVQALYELGYKSIPVRITGGWD